MIILLFGPPGCGKGTQAARIARRFRIPAISTGEVFRAELKAGTRLGQVAGATLKAGGLVGDEIVNQIVAERIRRPDCAAGLLLDGYPRTLPQAIFLDRLLAGRGLTAPVAIHLDVPADVLVARITARRQCGACGRIYNLVSSPPKTDGLCDADHAMLVRRDDDTEEVIRARLKAYEEATGPVISHYNRRGCLRVDGVSSPERIFREIERLLAECGCAELVTSGGR